MPPSYRDLFEVHLAYVQFVQAKSLVIHQYMRDISTTGASVEIEVRELIRSVLPDRFKVTSGFIVAADSKEETPLVSPQVDIIIADTLVPHSLWVVDSSRGTEVVPRESVVGVIEVKRTLNDTSTEQAIDHLHSIARTVGLRKDDPTALMPGGFVLGAGLEGPCRGNPLFGVIGLGADETFQAAPSEFIRRLLGRSPDDPLLLDFALSLSGVFTATATHGTTNYEARLVQSEPATAWAEASDRTGATTRVALAQGLGFIQNYVSRTCGRIAEAHYYFFNDAISAE